jgi:hypothetical protein
MQIDRPSDMWTKVNIKGYVFPPNGSDVVGFGFGAIKVSRSFTLY